MRGVGRGGSGEVVDPELGAEPGTVRGEVDEGGAGDAVGGQNGGEALAELWNGGGQCCEAAESGYAGEVEGVAVGVGLGFQGGGVFASEWKVKGGEDEGCR